MASAQSYVQPASSLCPGYPEQSKARSCRQLGAVVVREAARELPINLVGLALRAS